MLLLGEKLVIIRFLRLLGHPSTWLYLRFFLLRDTKDLCLDIGHRNDLSAKLLGRALPNSSRGRVSVEPKDERIVDLWSLPACYISLCAWQ